MKIEVFVREEEVILQATQLGRPMGDHYCTAHDTFKTEKTLTNESQKALEEAKEEAGRTNATVVIYNMSTLKGQLLARLKGVKSPMWRIVE